MVSMGGFSRADNPSCCCEGRRDMETANQQVPRFNRRNKRHHTNSQCQYDGPWDEQEGEAEIRWLMGFKHSTYAMQLHTKECQAGRLNVAKGPFVLDGTGLRYIKTRARCGQ